MLPIKHALVFALCLVAAAVTAQQDGDVLFTVAGEPVTVGEFRYIYGKTSGEAPKYDEASVMEYLDLYERFKLKVARARTMGLDTIKSLQQELAGYRRQLADNYLVNKQVTDRLVEQLHARQQQDIAFKHILFRFKGNPMPADTLALYQKVLAVKETLTANNFGEAAKTYSEDKYSKDRGGVVGFVTAPFPRGLHRLEDALYAAKTKEIVGPVRTSLGYHLAVKTDARPARGEVEVSHILIRKPQGTKAGVLPVPAQLQAAQKALANGKEWDELVRLTSEDKDTKDKGGYLGFFGINKYEKAFEEAAFGLTRDGAVSDIVETSAGFHLIRRDSRRTVQPLADVRPLLEQKIKADGRFEDAKKDMLRAIRRQGNVREDRALFGRYSATLVDSSFLDFRWKPGGALERGTLLAIGDDINYGLEQFQEYLRQNSRRRVSLGRAANSATVATRLYEDWVDSRLLAYAESRLEKDYPEFAALMREYREGILLFEATKLEVWDKASADTTGLRAFFEAHRDDYQFGQRAAVTEIKVKNSSGLDAVAVAAFAKKNGSDKALDHFGRNNFEINREEYDLDRLAELKIQPQAGSISDIKKDLRSAVTTFTIVDELLPPRRKELSEARGYVIADFQDQLERDWVTTLRGEYPVKVNKKVLGKLIQK